MVLMTGTAWGQADVFGGLPDIFSGSGDFFFGSSDVFGSVNEPPVPEGWPNASTTGVPSGTTLSAPDASDGYQIDEFGNIVVRTTDSATILEGIEMPSGSNGGPGIIIRKVGVTVRNSRVPYINIEFGHPAFDSVSPRTIIQDVEIPCTSPGGLGLGKTGVAGQNFTAERLNIHRCENGVSAGDNFTINDSFIHNPYNFNGDDGQGTQPHTDGIQVYDGDNAVIDHNVWYAFTNGCVWPDTTGACDGNAAINVNASPTGNDPPVGPVLIDDNVIAGGGYAMYCPRAALTNYQITNNRFSTVYSPNVGDFGPAVYCDDETKSGNVYHETGLPITLP
jgi:hypothetical protein